MAAVQDDFPILRYFTWGHLPADLQEISRRCAELAEWMAEVVDDGPQKDVGFQKLLEAKDAFVRACI